MNLTTDRITRYLLKTKKLTDYLNKVTTTDREQKKELANFGSQGKDASWGQQIRSYILQPYQLARDDRTGVKISNVMDVLDGNLQLFIEAEIKQDDN